MDKSRRKATSGLIFTLGFMAMLIGAITEVYETKVGVIIMIAILFVGSVIVLLIFGGKEETPVQSES